MSEIPKDVRQTAGYAAKDYHKRIGQDRKSRFYHEEILQKLIADVIMDEAERCARICEEIGSLMGRTPQEAVKAIRRGN